MYSCYRCILTTYNNKPCFICFLKIIFFYQYLSLHIVTAWRIWDIIMLNSSTYRVWQFIVLVVLLQNYPDVDNKSDRNVLVIYVIKPILYMCICWFHFIRLSNKYSKYMFLALIIHHAKRLCCILLYMWPAWLYDILHIIA